MRVCVLAALDTADGFFLFHSALLALGDEPALATDSTQDATFHHLLSKAFEQHIL